MTHDPDNDRPKGAPKVGRRGFLKAAAVGAAAISMPWVWVPSKVQARTAGFGTIKHLIYIRLSGGFRFTAAFNGDVAAEYNPFGLSSNVAQGAEWGVSGLLDRSGWLNDDLRARGLRTVPEIANDIAVLPCVDHEPLSAYADGNHGSGLERFLTGYVGGDVGLLTMLNYGLRERTEAALREGRVLLPAFVMGNAGMSLGAGKFAPYRAPVLGGQGFEGFGFQSDARLPEWAAPLVDEADQRHFERTHRAFRGGIEAYMRTREATEAYAEIFNSDALKVRSGSDDIIDGVSQRELSDILGDSRAARDLRLGLRLFSYGCPAVYLDQGGYDMHSGEEGNLPGRMEELCRLTSGLHHVLQKMTHPDGGTLWDHTVVVMGSEFGRTARGDRFNSARGSDHGGDLATRWMSMPMMGGPVSAIAGRQLGQTRRADLKAEGAVFAYRGLMKTLMDGLGADTSEIFTADEPFDDIFTG